MSNKRIWRLVVVLAVYVCFVPSILAQPTAFNYQGSLTDGGSPANGSYQMQFRLFDAPSGGTQIGSTLADVPVTALNGAFRARLDFGSNPLGGQDRWLEIAVRQNSGQSYTTLSPREQISSSPYAVRTLSAAMADDSQKLGGVNANQFVQTTDPRLSDARNPLPGSANYLQNSLTQQAAANFNISGSGTSSAFNVNGPLTFGNVAAPGVAPGGQSRFYFDTATNKLKISENGGAYVNLVGASGVSGSGTANRIPFWSAGTTLGDSNIFQSGTHIGIGTGTPGAALEIRGSALFAQQQRITDGTSGNSLVLQGGTGSNMKITGYNYTTGAAVPLYLSVDGANTILNSGGGSLGIGISTPHPLFRVDTAGSVRAFANTHVNFTVETSGTNNGARFNMKSATRNWFIGTSQALNGDQFYIGEGESLTAGQRMVITTGGVFGFGTINPHTGYRADFVGGIRSTDTASTHFVAETMGGTNSWARYYMRSVNPNGTIHQSWLMGTSRDFNGNQFYLADETFGGTRFAIQPNGGPVYIDGNVTGNLGGYGLPKAMLFINGDGTMIRCYNGVTGSTSGGCGYTSSRGNSGRYILSGLPDTNARFVSVSLQSSSNQPVGISFQPNGTFLNVYVFETNDYNGVNFPGTDRPFVVIIY